MCIASNMNLMHDLAPRVSQLIRAEGPQLQKVLGSTPVKDSVLLCSTLVKTEFAQVTYYFIVKRELKNQKKRLTNIHIIIPDIKAIHNDNTIKGRQSNSALIMLSAAFPGGLLAAIKATPGDSTRFMYAYSPMYFSMYLLP